MTKPEFVELPAACLMTDQSLRQNDQELDELADSLKRVGMLHPIILSDRKGTIVAGTGRLAAAKRAGMERVPVLIRPDLADPARRLLARYAENAHRKPLTPNEAATAIAQLKPILEAEAAKRQKVHGGTAPGRKANTGGKLPPVKRPKVRKQLAAATGLGERTVGKLDAIREAGERDPATFGHLVALAERTSIDAAHREMQRLQGHDKANQAWNLFLKKVARLDKGGRQVVVSDPAPPPADKAADVIHRLHTNQPLASPSDASTASDVLAARVRGRLRGYEATVTDLVGKLEDLYAEAGALSDDDLEALRIAVEQLARALGGEATW